jgi:hypothetical protein
VVIFEEEIYREVEEVEKVEEIREEKSQRTSGSPSRTGRTNTGFWFQMYTLSALVRAVRGLF